MKKKTAQIPELIYLTTYLMHSLSLQTGSMNLKRESKSSKTLLPNQAAIDLNFLSQGLSLYNNSLIDAYSSAKDLVSEIGSTKLFHFGGKGVPILLIPSHINKSFILDFSESQSFISKLKRYGLNPYLIDWSAPLEEEKKFGFEEYFNYRLKPVIDLVKVIEGRKLIISGYCMGGLFAIAAAHLLPDFIEGVITLATPWNFHTPNFLGYPMSKFYAASFKYLWMQLPYIPKQLIQLIFYFQSHQEINAKYIELGKGNFDLNKFAYIENWASDGIDMSTPLFLECMEKFILLNQSYLNTWEVNGELIIPDLLAQKSFCAVAMKDKITPISSTIPLGMALRNCTLKSVDSGHLGMIISEKHSIAPTIAEWVKSNFE